MSTATAAPVEIRISNAAIPATCWGGTDHTLHEVGLSTCEHACKVYECAFCHKRFVLHSTIYGCRIR